mgnify:CR=1 FL=1
MDRNVSLTPFSRRLIWFSTAYIVLLFFIASSHVWSVAYYFRDGGSVAVSKGQFGIAWYSTKQGQPRLTWPIHGWTEQHGTRTKFVYDMLTETRAFGYGHKMLIYSLWIPYFMAMAFHFSVVLFVHARARRNYRHRCRTCGYDISCLPSTARVCPECGRRVT